MSDPFRDRLPFDPAALQNLSFKDKVKTLAPFLLPQLEKIDNPIVQMLVSDIIESEYDALKYDLRNSDLADRLFDGIARLKQLSFIEVRDALASSLATPETARQSAQTTGQLVSQMSEAEYIRLQKAALGVLPPAAQQYYAANFVPTGETLDSHLSNVYRMTQEQRAIYNETVAHELDVTPLAMAAYEVIQKLNPPAVIAAIETFTGMVSGEQLTETALGGVNVLRDLLQTVSAQDKLALTDKAAALRLAGNVADIFNAVGASLSRAGLTPDTDIGPAIKQATDYGLAAARQAAPKSDKKPGNGSFKL